MKKNLKLKMGFELKVRDYSLNNIGEGGLHGGYWIFSYANILQTLSHEQLPLPLATI